MTLDAWLVGRRGQALAAGLVVLTLALGWFGIVDPVRSFFEDRSLLLEQRQALLHRMREVAATLPDLRSAAAAQPGRGNASETMMLPGATDAVAAADLQERLQKMAAAAGANLDRGRNASSLTPVRATGINYLCGSASMPRGPFLMELLRSIEQSSTTHLDRRCAFPQRDGGRQPSHGPADPSVHSWCMASARPKPGAGT